MSDEDGFVITEGQLNTPTSSSEELNLATPIHTHCNILFALHFDEIHKLKTIISDMKTDITIMKNKPIRSSNLVCSQNQLGGSTQNTWMSYMDSFGAVSFGVIMGYLIAYKYN